MPLFNVTVTKETTMVVEAEDCDHAREVARNFHEDAFFDDGSPKITINVTGEVNHFKHLRNGWSGDCVPYGGDGSTMLSEFISE